MTVEEKVAVIQGLEDKTWEILAVLTPGTSDSGLTEKIERYQRIRANLRGSEQVLPYCICKGGGSGQVHLFGSIVCDNRMPGG